MSATPAHLHLELGDAYQTSISARNHTWLGDQSPDAGGADTGPTPWELLLSSLASCTAVTVRMYAQRKGWSIESVVVDAHRDADESIRMEVEIVAPGLAQNERERLAQVAQRCPVVRGVQAGLAIDKSVAVRDQQ